MISFLISYSQPRTFIALFSAFQPIEYIDKLTSFPDEGFWDNNFLRSEFSVIKFRSRSLSSLLPYYRNTYIYSLWYSFSYSKSWAVLNTTSSSS